MNKIKASKRSMEMDYAIREVTVPAAAAAVRGMKLYSLNIGDPNKWDFETPEYFKATLREAVDNTDNGYGDSQGNLNLRKAIVDREYEKNGVRITAEDVYVTSGLSECINVMMAALIDSGDELLIPGPGYSSYNQYVAFYGGRPVPYRQMEEEDWRPDTDMIRKRITPKTKGIVVINPNNPTSAVYDEKTIREIGDIAGEHGLPLISDEIYDKLVFEGRFFSASRLPDDLPRIILNGFSKVNLIPGWREGYCYFMDRGGVLDDVREGMMRQFRIRICPNVPCQEAARVSLQGPQGYIKEMNDKLKARADLSHKRLNEIPGISANRARGAFYMFPKVDLSPWKSDRDFVLDLISEEGVVVVHGSGFCSEFGQGHFRTILLPPEAVINEAYDRLERFMQRRL
ncbi:MAG: aminotransferase class I/II-fold pyridoxal phosphate-dependent enzyme [Candidatus Methanoplasma sp.]|jgi:aspartate/methionine/tyrosine aminotransferase|nr:aminotransferase class I/II-fold pyridoxal phosphate-dependent enzyme [Candidatus Methanoplasma sp.]